MTESIDEAVARLMKLLDNANRATQRNLVEQQLRAEFTSLIFMAVQGEVLQQDQRKLKGLTLAVWACSKPVGSATPEQMRELLAQCVPYLRAATPQPAIDTDKLRQIIASMYQIAGALDAPEHVLDVLANLELTTQAQIDALLAFVPTTSTRPAPPLQDAKDAKRFKQAIAFADNAESLYCTVLNCGGDGDSIRREFDNEIASQKGAA